MSQRVIKITLKIQGMTCSSCERRIGRTLARLEGVLEQKIDFSRSEAKILLNIDEENDQNKHIEKTNRIATIVDAIERIGYTVDSVIEHDDFDKHTEDNRTKYMLKVNQLIGIAVILFALYFILDRTVGFNFIPEVNPSMGYGLLFVVGLLTSIHCIAMCGGINLSQCISYNKNTNEAQDNEKSDFNILTSTQNVISKNIKGSRIVKMNPSLLYNLGRVLSYTIIGGIAGAIGSVVTFSGYAKGLVAIVAGIFMIIMGLNMLNIFPWLRRLNPRIPRFLDKLILKRKSNKGPFYVGLLNGLMPCGPLQTMQLYALGTGSFAEGAISMLLFSLGTVPLMFGLGVLSSFLSSKLTHRLMKISAALVIALGLVMMNRGLSLSGVSVAYTSTQAENIAVIQGDKQIVSTKVNSSEYEPFIVQKGIPVKWIINVSENDLNGCNNPLTVPKYNIQKKLVPGENVIEFTPDEEGKIIYTCWMGMIRSNITVVSDLNNIAQQDYANSTDIQKDLFGGGSCSAGASNAFAGGKIPVEQLAIGNIKDGVQYVSIDINDYGFSPAVVVIQKGIPTEWVLNGEKLNSCNYRLQFPAYNSNIELREGENLIKFTPEKDFYFSCWMSMINGYVKVVDDIENIDLEEIRNEVVEFELPEDTGGCCG